MNVVEQLIDKGYDAAYIHKLFTIYNINIVLFPDKEILEARLERYKMLEK